MVTKRVTIEIRGDDSQIKRVLDEIERRKRELSGSQIRIGFNGNGVREGTADMDRLAAKLDQLNRRAINISVGRKSKAEVDDLRRVLREINGTWDARVQVKDFTRTKLQLDELERQLRKIGRTEDEIRLKNLGNKGGLLGRLMGNSGGAGGAGGGAGGLPGNLTTMGMGNPIIAGVVGDLVAMIGSLIPAALGTLTGAGVAGGGILLGLKLNPRDMKGFKNDLHQMLAPIAQDTRPLISGLFHLMGPLAQFVKQMGPQLSGMFKASIPFLSMFVHLMEQSAKVLIPAFTQTMKEMAPYLPQMDQALLQLVKALAYFLKDLGPGMKDSATIWKAMAIAVKGIMIGLAAVLNFLAHLFVRFGQTMNDIGHVAAAVWHFIAGQTSAGAHAVAGFVTGLWHSIVSIFDTIKSTATSVWNSLWNDITSVVQAAAGAIMGVIGGILSAISSIGSAISHLPGSGVIGGMLSKVGLSTGGYVPGTGSPNVDSRLIMAAPGERVLSHAEIANAGGPGVVDALFGQARQNRGHAFSSGGWIPHGNVGNVIVRKFLFNDAMGGGKLHPGRGPGLLHPPGHHAGGVGTLHEHGASGHGVININFNGIVTNPDATAREVRRILLDYKRNHGNTALGLS